MAPLWNFGKTHISTFGVGLLFGLTLSYLLRYTERTGIYSQQAGSFIPYSPHSHGENDDVSGPESYINWNDSHSHRHASKN